MIHFPNSRLHVLAAPCDTCIFNPRASPIGPERFKELIETWRREDTYQQCHHATLARENVMCRGFYEWAKKTGNEPTAMQIGERLGLMVEVEQATLDQIAARGQTRG